MTGNWTRQKEAKGAAKTKGAAAAAAEQYLCLLFPESEAGITAATAWKQSQEV